VQRAGPYLLLEILMPGGTLFALLLFLYRRSQQIGATDAPRMSAGIARAIGRAHKEMMCTALSWDIASVWRGRHRQRDGLEALAMTPLI
jgi:hypothetical protein